jgi:hypothetical protein
MLQKEDRYYVRIGALKGNSGSNNNNNDREKQRTADKKHSEEMYSNSICISMFVINDRVDCLVKFV